jgi:hypothetical protein
MTDNALRSDYGSFTPNQMLMLRNMGLLGYPDAPMMTQAGTTDSPVRANMTGFDQGNTSMLMGGANVPMGDFTAGLGGMRSQRGKYESFSISPSMAVALGKLRAGISRRYDNGQMADQTYSLGYDFGPAEFSYDRRQPVNSLAMDNYNLNVPIGQDTNFNANVATGKGMPTNYQVGVDRGNFGIAGEYTPETNDAALFARYKMNF